MLHRRLPSPIAQHMSIPTLASPYDMHMSPGITRHGEGYVVSSNKPNILRSMPGGIRRRPTTAIGQYISINPGNVNISTGSDGNLGGLMSSRLGQS